VLSDWTGFSTRGPARPIKYPIFYLCTAVGALVHHVNNPQALSQPTNQSCGKLPSTLYILHTHGEKDAHSSVIHIEVSISYSCSWQYPLTVTCNLHKASLASIRYTSTGVYRAPAASQVHQGPYKNSLYYISYLSPMACWGQCKGRGLQEGNSQTVGPFLYPP